MALFDCVGWPTKGLTPKTYATILLAHTDTMVVYIVMLASDDSGDGGATS